MADYLGGVDVKPGDIVLFENVRFNKGEKKNSDELAQRHRIRTGPLPLHFLLDGRGVLGRQIIAGAAGTGRRLGRTGCPGGGGGGIGGARRGHLAQLLLGQLGFVFSLGALAPDLGQLLVLFGFGLGVIGLLFLLGQLLLLVGLFLLLGQAQLLLGLFLALALGQVDLFLAALGLLLLLGLKPLGKLSDEAQKLAPPKLSGRLQLSPLPPELSQFVNSFNSTLDRVEQAYSRLESFNADVAHELRSPLTNLIGQTQVALTRGRSAEHYFEVLQSNREELERLRSIINDMLFLASADQGSKATKLIESSLADEVATTLDYLDFILEDAQVQVRVRGDALVQIEKAHLRRALINLLSNAVQHTAPGQVIEVNIEVQDHHVAIGVTNPGDEIASEHLPRLFERFYRVDASRSNSGANHGLGLAIVKAIALMHGGDVFVRSDGGGNTFGITLPV